jgi:ketol-acid reductoisomerase
MRYSISDTAEHGDYTAGPKIITDDTRRAMKKILEDIQSGEYARGWIAENKAGRPWFNQIREQEQNQLVERVGSELRALMPFLKPVTVKQESGKSPAAV